MSFLKGLYPENMFGRATEELKETILNQELVKNFSDAESKAVREKSLGGGKKAMMLAVGVLMLTYGCVGVKALESKGVISSGYESALFDDEYNPQNQAMSVEEKQYAENFIKTKIPQWLNVIKPKNGGKLVVGKNNFHARSDDGKRGVFGIYLEKDGKREWVNDAYVLGGDKKKISQYELIDKIEKGMKYLKENGSYDFEPTEDYLMSKRVFSGEKKDKEEQDARNRKAEYEDAEKKSRDKEIQVAAEMFQLIKSGKLREKQQEAIKNIPAWLKRIHLTDRDVDSLGFKVAENNQKAGQVISLFIITKEGKKKPLGEIRSKNTFGKLYFDEGDFLNSAAWSLQRKYNYEIE